MSDRFSWLDSVPHPCWDNVSRLAGYLSRNSHVSYDEIPQRLGIEDWESELLLLTLNGHELIDIREQHWATGDQYLVMVDDEQRCELEQLIVHLQSEPTAASNSSEDVIGIIEQMTSALRNPGADKPKNKRGRPDGSTDVVKATLKKVAQRLKDLGWSDEDIAPIVDRGRSTVTGWLNEMSD